MDATPVERWLPVVGFDGLYEVSDQGRVLSLPRETLLPGGGARMSSQSPRLLNPNRGRYRRVTLFNSSTGSPPRYAQVHTLVLEAPAPKAWSAAT